MPRDNKKILIIGAGPIVIGQGCEFDYSGTQACRALTECGYQVVLINSNPATIMTDPEIADVTYIEPICTSVIEKIIAREKPAAVLATMGGQTALNCAMELYNAGILKKYNVELIGTNAHVLEIAENRILFKQAMVEIGLSVPQSYQISKIEDAEKIINYLSFPIIIRPSFTLGGAGSGIAYNQNEYFSLCERALQFSPIQEALIEQSVIGWKEFEMEVVRDKNDNCIIVCSIENVDPMGVHTGDSVAVSPAQTLTDKEYQIMRRAAFAVVKKVGVVGGANVQFAINPVNGDMVVIEMNPRVSRSSALASKATGFPIAKVSAKLAVGLTLNEIYNELTGKKISAAFEPVIDYVVTKMPRFNFDKFPDADPTLTTQMKAVGEVMAIGRTFQESLQKAIVGLEEGYSGLDEQTKLTTDSMLELISRGHPKRLLFIAELFRRKIDIEKIYNLTFIDYWFLYQLQELVELENNVNELTINNLDKDFLYYLKRKGFSDKRLAKLLSTSEEIIRNLRIKLNVRPVYKRVDTCAAEFPTNSFYLYSTYEEECEAALSENKKILVIGSGPNRIGQGIEFDYSCVHASWAVKELGYEAIMVNCNPSTVSTDYDISSRLYFEPIVLENILEILHKEKPQGIIVQCGGQAPLKLAAELSRLGFNILGTSYQSIDEVENRDKFRTLLQTLSLPQPRNLSAKNVDELVPLAREIGFPVVLRPSYVLGGARMRVVNDEKELQQYIQLFSGDILGTENILVEKFLENAIEYDVDAVSDGKQVFIAGMMEQVEFAGVHSGDSTCSLSQHIISPVLVQKIHDYLSKLNNTLNIRGFFNVQLALYQDELFIIEVNPRASRTMPFVSKSKNIPLVKVAIACMLGDELKNYENKLTNAKMNYFTVKCPIFSFEKFSDAQQHLGMEMKSTGEIMSIGNDHKEAFFKAYLCKWQIKTNQEKKLFLYTDNVSDYKSLLNKLFDFGLKVFSNVQDDKVEFIAEEYISELIKQEKIDLVLKLKGDKDKSNFLKNLSYESNALFFDSQEYFFDFIEYINTGHRNIMISALQHMYL